MGWLLPAALQGGGGHRGMSLVGGYYGMAASLFFWGGVGASKEKDYYGMCPAQLGGAVLSR